MDELVTAPLGTATGDGLVPSMTVTVVIGFPLGLAAADGLAPVVSEGEVVSCPIGTATAFGLTPAVHAMDGDQAEVAMIRSVFKIIDSDSRVQAKYKVRRLLEVRKRFKASDVGYLAVSGVPVQPQEKPTMSEDIFVDIYIEPVLAEEETTRDSKLEMNREFHEFRKLLYSESSLPLHDADDPSRVISHETMDFDFRGVDFSVPGIRIPIYVARYQSKINLPTGDWLVGTPV